MNGEQIARLQRALLSAFPSWEMLEQMVQIRLDEVLETIVARGSLQTVTFDLIVWSISVGRAEDLILGAHAHNPGNPTLAAFVAIRPAKVPESAVPIAGPATLPLPPPAGDDDFVGREAQLARLAEMLVEPGPGDRRAAFVCGMGGMGKTMLARHFVATQAGAFPGGVLWGELGTNRDEGERGAAQNPEAVLRATLERWEAELGGSYAAGRPVAVLLGAMRRLLAHRQAAHGRCLAVLDNVDAESTLKILSALTDCAVLITSRQRSLAETAKLRFVMLEGLGREASIAYFAKALGPTDGRTGELNALLERIEDHPLAVALLASAMKDDSKLSPDDALAIINRSAPGPGPAEVKWKLDACFRLSIDRLPAGPLRPLLIATASLSPVSWPSAALDHISGICSEAQTLGLLARLRDLGLVEPLGGNRFRVHRLMRDHLLAEHAKEGFGFIREGWEIASLPWWLMRSCPGISAGFATYNLRQEAFFLRLVTRHGDESAQIREEWDNLALALVRRSGRGSEAVIRGRLSLIRRLLPGADLAGMSLRGVVLDGTVLDNARLEDADLSSEPLRWWPSLREIKAFLLPTAFAMIVSVICLAGAVELLAQIRDDFKVLKIDPLDPTLVAVAALVPLPELLTRLVLGGGRWFDRHSFMARIVLERAVVLVVSVVLVAGTASALALGMPGHGVDLPYEIAMVGLPALFGGPLLTVASVGSEGMKRWAARVDLGGLGRRLGLFVMMVAFIALIAYAGLVRLSRAEPSLGTFALAIGLVVCAGFGALSSAVFAVVRHPEVGLPVYSLKACYLRAASLVGANLRRAKLSWARLQGANLTGAKLEATSFEHASLEGAILSGARLMNARLTNADLSNADLRDANLTGADLTGANLMGAQLGGSIHDRSTRWPAGFTPP